MDAELHLHHSEFFLKLFALVQQHPMVLLNIGQREPAAQLERQGKANRDGTLQNAKDVIVTSPEISDEGSSATCLATSEATQTLRDVISGSLFLRNQVRGHLFYLEL